jgi:hypothetical protein
VGGDAFQGRDGLGEDPIARANQAQGRQADRGCCGLVVLQVVDTADLGQGPPGVRVLGS